MWDEAALWAGEAHIHILPPSTSSTIRALFSTVSPLSSHEVDGVRKEKERLTDGKVCPDLTPNSSTTIRIMVDSLAES